MLHISHRRTSSTKEDVSKKSDKASACKLAHTNPKLKQKSNFKVTVKESTQRNRLRLFFVG